MAGAADLAAALEAQSRFVAAASHELRTPIAHQRALVEVALADRAADAASLRAMGERVIAGCVEQERLIESLLAWSRCRSGLARWDQVDLSAAAAAALEECDRGGLACAVSLRPATTAGDPLLVERLAANLVSNASRHNVPGGWLRVSTGCGSGCAFLRVENSGPPLSPAELARLVRPFQRGDGAPGGGVGLGLSIVEAIAAAHDATLVARPRPDGGLDVEVAFPA